MNTKMDGKIKIDATIMDNFYKLVHSQQNLRLTAASSTFKILKAMSGKKQDIFNENLNYCVERLVAGLASSRAQARRGYGTLLLEILGAYHVSTERLLTLAYKKFSHISKETSRDNLLGYYLLIAIIMKSNNYKRTKGNSQHLEKIYKLLIQLHNTKSYLECPVSETLTEHYQQFHEFMVRDIPPQAFESDAKIKPLDLLKIALCHKKESIRNLQNLDKSSLLELLSALHDEKLQKRPLHPVYLEASKLVMNAFPTQFKIYHETILRPIFFKPNHNELAAMGLELTSFLIASTNNLDLIKILMNDHVLRIIILSLRNHTPLREGSMSFFKSIGEHMKTATDEKQLGIMKLLITSPGSINFDEDSKSSILKTLIQLCSKDCLKSYLAELLENTTNKNQRESIASTKQISIIISRPNIVEDHETLERSAKHFLNLITRDQEPDEPLKVAYLTCYHNILGQIISHTNHTQRNEILDSLIRPYVDGKLQDSKLWLNYVSQLNKFKILKRKHQDLRLLYPIESLYLFYGLQVIEHNLECDNQLDELHTICIELTKSTPQDSSWADILTDQILAILSATECKPWIRKLCEKVFGAITPHISKTAIDLICDAVRTSPSGEEEESDGDSIGSAEDGYAKSPEENGDTQMDGSDDESSVDHNGDLESKLDHAMHEESTQMDDDSEEYLDDEQMMKLDSVIATMFKENRKKRIDPSFQLRCLDLLDILLRKSKDPAIVNSILATIIPIYTSSRKYAETRPISDKIITSLNKVSSKSKHPNLVDFLAKHNKINKTKVTKSK